MNETIQDYFRCPGDAFDLCVSGSLSPEPGFFKVNGGAIAYGRATRPSLSADPSGELPDLGGEIHNCSGPCWLPFDLREVAENLRFERYPTAASVGIGSAKGGSLVRRTYYLVRPLLPVAVRRHLQRAALRGWDSIPFPRWPVDVSVDEIIREVFKAGVARSPEGRIPFIWFWPEGRPAAMMMTHDVETEAGRAFCPELMNLDESHGLKSAFQFVPEERYEVAAPFLASIRERGFEINVHGLNHDGNLFKTREIFESRVGRINEYGRKWRARGFRAPVLYRNIDWFDGFKFDYDMTLPNTAHLDPQRGGCATVMPFFIGKLLELPLTTIQDYPLFNILGDYTIDLWKKQIEMITGRNGLISFNIHPDYLLPKRAREVYVTLLTHLAELRARLGIWGALPGEINDWWRRRAAMQLVREGSDWKISGEGSDEAVIAYAWLEEGELKFEVGDTAHRHAA